jgi:hypothetical protein
MFRLIIYDFSDVELYQGEAQRQTRFLRLLHGISCLKFNNEVYVIKIPPRSPANNSLFTPPLLVSAFVYSTCE